MKTLIDLKKREKGIVKEIICNNHVHIHRRLLDMGLTPGTAVEMIKEAPLGDPLEFKLKNYLLSLRKSEASMVKIEEEVINL